MDGTFNQTKPLFRLVPSFDCFSFDLKSATDRWPLVFMFEKVAMLFDRSFASSVVNSALGTKSLRCLLYEGGPLRCVSRLVSHLGITALGLCSHSHTICWCGGVRSRLNLPGIRFDRYAVLGDDVLSTDPAVAEHYRASLKRLGVSEHKSLISSTGSVEFAKRFLVKGMQIDLSPVSMKSVLGFHHPYGLMAIHEKYDLKRFSTFVRIGGGGYRTLSNLNNIKSSKWRRLKLMWDKRRLPLEYLLGSGVPLNPYLHGELVRLLRRKMAPKD